MTSYDQGIKLWGIKLWHGADWPSLLLWCQLQRPRPPSCQGSLPHAAFIWRAPCFGSPEGTFFLSLALKKGEGNAAKGVAYTIALISSTLPLLLRHLSSNIQGRKEDKQWKVVGAESGRPEPTHSLRWLPHLPSLPWIAQFSFATCSRIRE